MTRSSILQIVPQADPPSLYVRNKLCVCPYAFAVCWAGGSSALHEPGENAHMESFFHSLKAELLHGATFKSDEDLRRALRAYLQYYNGRRLHSVLGYRAPVDYESPAA